MNADQIKKSNAKIAKARDVLACTMRGQRVIRDLQALFSGQAAGLDHQGARALSDLVREFAINHRRDFLP